MIDWPLERELERSYAAAVAARERIADFVRVTPTLGLEEGADGVARTLKLELLQRTGSFKVRGAAAALSAGERPRAVVAASTGNHGLAVVAVAAALELPCRVFVPAAAAPAKLARLRAAAGVEVVEVEGDPLLAELAAREVAEGEPRTLLVPPYNDANVVLGQATLGLELLEQLTAAPDALFVAVGGGGLISGIALAVRERWPQCRIVGCVPAASPAMAAAVAAGAVVAAPLEPTLSDATAGGIEDGAITVAICAALVDEFVLVSEEEIASAMGVALLEHSLGLEGASALALAASLRDHSGGKHVVVLGGGNVGAETLRRVLS
ncbi:MAG TPA: pyridoxal-phosphate dependent enzyme [Solirubrobacteraceae bacterium]